MCLFIKLSWDVLELDPVKFVFELSYFLAVQGHGITLATPFLHDLIDSELRVPVEYEASNAQLDRDLEAIDEGCGRRSSVGAFFLRPSWRR